MRDRETLTARRTVHVLTAAAVSPSGCAGNMTGDDDDDDDDSKVEFTDYTQPYQLSVSVDSVTPLHLATLTATIRSTSTPPSAAGICYYIVGQYSTAAYIIVVIVII